MTNREDCFDDELPFDELDPCCQREIINNRRKREVNQKLSQVDRSLQRLQQQQCVFTFQNNLYTCGCCSSLPQDYPALAQYKQEIEVAAQMKSSQEEEEEEEEVERRGEDDEDDSDDDSLLNDIPLTPEEQKRLQEQQSYASLLQKAQSSYHLGNYYEDSIEHLLEEIMNPTIPILIHFYQPYSRQSAIIDYHIEKRIACQYLGTRFRRLEYWKDDFFAYPQFQRWQSQLIIGDDKDEDGCDLLVCFKNNELISLQKHLKEFGNHPEDIYDNLMKFLNHSHILEKNLPHPSLIFPNRKRNTKQEEEEEEEEESLYCDDPDCTKRYPHEHIGKSSKASSSVSTPSFIEKKREGQEALAPEVFRRI